MCSGSEAGSCLRLIDFVFHSTLGLRVIKKKFRWLVVGMSSRNERLWINQPPAVNYLPRFKTDDCPENYTLSM